MSIAEDQPPMPSIQNPKFQSLQRSNAELRKQVENQARTIDELKVENREAVEHHQNEMEGQRDTISKPYLVQLNQLNESFKTTKNKLTEVNKTSAGQKHTIEDLNVRVDEALQSFTEANDIIKSQKAAITELKTQLDEARGLRKEEREKAAAADLKSGVQKVASEAQEELKRASDVALRREREQQEVIIKFQESEKESSALVESLRSKLEETRKKIVVSENKFCQLETQVFEEQQASASRKKRVEELEVEMNTMRSELDKEKAAREEARPRHLLLKRR